MKLLTKEIINKLPPLGATENESNPRAVCKFFTPDAQWTWHVFEYDGKDMFFGFVEGFVKEWGYFSLKEISSVRGPLGLKIERDLYYTPISRKDAMEMMRK